jgi:transcriptional regulator of NAD metabolism
MQRRRIERHLQGSTGMTGQQRREQILRLISEARTPITGAELASRFGVSRQVIVQDIALLRAKGAEILATPQGYTTITPPDAAVHRAVIAVRHDRAQTADELNILVDRGLHVVDVVVEHPLYGELRGLLMLETRDDVAEFMRRLEESQAPLLSSLTDGVHLHTVEARRPEAIQRARDELRRLGILLSETENGGTAGRSGAHRGLPGH